MFLSLPLLAQQQKLLYINGAVLDADSLRPLSGTTIKNTNTRVDLITNEEGLFRLRAYPGDTLLMQHMTYQPVVYVVPKNLKSASFAFVQLMRKEKVLDPVTIYRFPTQLQFEQEILQLNLPGNVRAKATDLEQHLEQVTNDPTNMQQYIDDYMRYQFMYIVPEQGMPNNFLNPERWSNFIRDWREGRFTQRGMEKLDGFPADLKDEDGQ